MDALSNALQDYKEIVGNLAFITTVGQFFSGAIVCYDIKKKGSTEGFDIMPFLGGIVFGILNMKFAFILQDIMMIRVNVAALTLNIIYLYCFYKYAPNKGVVWRKIGLGAVFVAVFIAYSVYENPDHVEYRYGMIMTFMLFGLIGAPLFGLGEIIRKKSTAGLPFPMILSGTVVTFLWLLYGIIIKNNFVIFQNVVGFSLSAFQLSLFVIYPSKQKKIKPKKIKKLD